MNYLAVSSQRVQRSERSLNICNPSKEYVGNARITSLVVLKINVDNAILELCDSCDFFASPLIK